MFLPVACNRKRTREKNKRAPGEVCSSKERKRAHAINVLNRKDRKPSEPFLILYAGNKTS